jgi:hypothetical protein
MEPRLQVVGIDPDDAVVQRFRFRHCPVQPGALGAEDELVVWRQTLPMLEASIGHLPGQLRQGASRGCRC